MYVDAMPSETIYLREEQYDFLKGMIEGSIGVNNMSQAVQYCVNVQEQREDAIGHTEDQE